MIKKCFKLRLNKLDKKLKYYMLDNDLDDKRKAIVEVLNKALVK